MFKFKFRLTDMASAHYISYSLLLAMVIEASVKDDEGKNQTAGIRVTKVEQYLYEDGSEAPGMFILEGNILRTKVCNFSPSHFPRFTMVYDEKARVGPNAFFEIIVPFEEKQTVYFTYHDAELSGQVTGVRFRDCHFAISCCDNGTDKIVCVPECEIRTEPKAAAVK